MPNFKQAGRLMQFASSLGQDTLLIQTLEGVEGISRLFDFQAELIADASTEIDPAALVGNKVTIAIDLVDVQGTRYINGLVESFEQTSATDEFSSYRAHLVPSLWQLTLSSNCRVFQNKTVMDIIKEVIGPYGMSLTDLTSETYMPLDYCTQYDETDFNFVSRLAEQFGISYWFDHKNGDNTVVFADDRIAYCPCLLVSTVQYSPQADDGEDAYHSIISDIRAKSSMVTGKHTTRDVDITTYKMNENGPIASTHEYGKNAFERYLFPVGEAAYVKGPDVALTVPNHGKTILAAQRDATDVPANVFRGVSTARTFIPGSTFEMTEHPRSEWNQHYLLTEVVHHVEQTPPYRTDDKEPLQAYSNRFVAIESTRVFRPMARTPKPRIPGTQTAMVVGPSGEEIYVDKLGRICVQFFWDRQRSLTPDNTWVRVAQQWAGNGRGFYFWPRVNDEVVVSFLDGNPDAPLVVGSVYNAVNMPAYQLPDMSTRSGLITRSSKGGGATNANELRFEDKTGSEQIFLNAEKDMDHRTENDNRRYVGGQDSLIVTKDRNEQIGADLSVNVKGNKMEQTATRYDLNVGTDWNVKAGGNMSLDIGSNLAEKTGGTYSMDSTSDVYIKSGTTLVLEGTAGLTIKGPGGFVTIDASGVAISGMLVNINSGGAALSGSAGSTTAPQPPKDPDKADDGTKGGKM